MSLEKTLRVLGDKVREQGQQLQALREAIGHSKELDTLLQLMASDEWPQAIDPTLICDVSSEQDKEYRANNIVDLMIEWPLKGMKFLDFGCGEGHVTDVVSTHDTSLTVGYDLMSHDRWADGPNKLFTTDWSAVVENGPYNITLMYDVIDHIEGDSNTVLEKLRLVRDVMIPNKSRLIVRCHPWVSRHGGHLYREINKAYIHLVFTKEELELMGCPPPPMQHIVHPMMTYKNWFEKARFNMQRSPQITKESIEPIFQKNPLIVSRIKQWWATSHDPLLRTGKKFPLQQLEQQFLDYMLI